MVDRATIGDAVRGRLVEEADALRAAFRTPGRIPSFVLDRVLGPDLAQAVSDAFPAVEAMSLKRSIREDKYVGAQMDRYPPLLEEALFAFQEPGVVEAVGAITGIPALEPDGNLYVGGISVMRPGQSLNPHIDNSHDRTRTRYRVLNLLYYASPGWSAADGGALQLWDGGLRRQPREVECRFDRLVVMATHRRSFHSVAPVTADRDRRCVSNYYFAPRPVDAAGRAVDGGYFHVTSFRGFPHQRGRDLVLRADGLVRQGLRRLFPLGVRPNPHYYERGEAAGGTGGGGASR